MAIRDVEKVVIAREQAEGLGARVRRSIGRPELPNLDPFLLLDEFHVTKPAGFPEYVIYILYFFLITIFFNSNTSLTFPIACLPAISFFV